MIDCTHSILSILTNQQRNAEVYRKSIQCILWSDKERQWEKAIPLLKQEMPELLSLGQYNPEARTGPAVWLRCAIVGKIPNIQVPDGRVAIIYLPGVSRQDLRAIESCPEELKPLVELQFRGIIWSQYNGKDWTLLSYLVSDKGGLGLDIASDTETKQALQNALIPLLSENIEDLQGKRLDKDYFNSLLTGGDPIRDMLNWLDLGEGFKQNLSSEQWQAFNSTSKSKYGIIPDKDGLLIAIKALVDINSSKVKTTAWQQTWERYCDTPSKFPNIPILIRKLPVPDDWMYQQNTDGSFDRYPQWNADQEEALQQALLQVGSMPAKEARSKIIELEKQHGRRRNLIWAELGDTKYAIMLKDLVQIVELAEHSLDNGSLDEIENRYSGQLWQIDRSVLDLLAKIDSGEDLRLLNGILHTLYIPWIDSSARFLQKAGLLLTDSVQAPDLDVEAVLFIDGLRFDCAKKLSEMLITSGFEAEECSRWTGLPTITATCKPILVKAMVGEASHTGYLTNFDALSSYEFKKLLEKNHWQIVNYKETIPVPSRNAGALASKLWMEYGNLDELGHSQGWKLAKHIPSTLTDIVNTVKNILSAGWETVLIVTDHGWLLSPMGLPKTELSPLMSDTKWHRFASLKQGASTKEHIHSWYWGEMQQIAMADGISCYRSGVEYTHGGLSIQECLLMDIKIKKPEGAKISRNVKITDIKWAGLRCTIATQGQGDGFSFDIRTSPADFMSTVVLSTKPIKSDHTASVVVEDENLSGAMAYIVVLDQDNNIVSQIKTTIGGGTDDSTG